MDSILAQFDFKGKPCPYAPPDALTLSRLDEEAAVRAKTEQAAAIGDTKALKEVLGQASDVVLQQPGNILSRSIENGQYESVECLLQHGVGITTNAVKMAVERRDEEMKILQLFLRHGWDINMQLGLTLPSALALAIELQDSPCSAWLLQHGASPNARCALDLTPLSYAITHAPIPLINLLFDNGASIHHGQPLHYAVLRTLPDYLEVLDLVLSKDPPINHIMYQEDPTSYYQQRVFALGTPLHSAARLGRLDICRILVAKGADVRIRDSRGEIPLQRAEKGGWMAVIDFLAPLTERARSPVEQFTRGKEATAWG